MTKFAIIGLGHGHLFMVHEQLCAAGFDCAGFNDDSHDEFIAARFATALPQLPRLSLDAIWDDPTIELVFIVAEPRLRAPLAVEALAHHKHVMLDKPVVLTMAELDALRVAQARSGKTLTAGFNERLCVRAAVKAAQLIADGAIGQVVQTIGLGPHRLDRHRRSDWFFEPDGFGAILQNIAAHQIDQFLHFTGATHAEVVSSTVGNLNTPDHPGFNDFGEILLRAGHATGFIRVDWFTPAGLPTWGDGRTIILGTEGYIELRKYVDIAGRPGAEHLFLVDRDGMHHVDCRDVPLTFFAALRQDILSGTETAMPHEHVFEVTRLSIAAQQLAGRISPQTISAP